ncbi:MAG: hypothetical protein K2X34_02110, partial [Hyphomonadaceae bacterium]|nr:hypothetical protein [Hyphomonadaceae bacterium]
MTTQLSHPFADLSASAAGGDARAQLKLAHAAIIQARGAPSPEEGVDLLAAACAQNLPEAFLFQAALWARGVLGAKNTDAAYALVKHAASLGSAAA